MAKTMEMPTVQDATKAGMGEMSTVQVETKTGIHLIQDHNSEEDFEPAYAKSCRHFLLATLVANNNIITLVFFSKPTMSILLL